MGIQINGQTDTVTSTTSGGSVTVTPATFPNVSNINVTGVVTATSGFSGNVTGNVTGNINSSGVSTIATLRVGTGVTVSSGVITATGPINLMSTPFYQNNQNVSSNFTISGSTNALTAGPVAINTGVTVAISTGGYWKII